MVYIWEMAAIAGGAGGEKLSESGTHTLVNGNIENNKGNLCKYIYIQKHEQKYMTKIYIKRKLEIHKKKMVALLEAKF